MSRRVARSRLYELNKEGEVLTSTAGPNMTGSIGRQSRLRSGELIVTEITVDLASSNGACHSFATTGAGASANKVIGVSSSVAHGAVHDNAQLMLINTTASAADSVGILTDAELICVETPGGGGVHIGLWYGSNASGSSAKLDNGGTELIAAKNMATGKDAIASDIDVLLDDKYLYLVHSGSGEADYTSGKFIVRLHGYNVFDDV